MRLERLIIQGFKSFKDRTIIEFNDGITGIVGPNGCGKSNIVDALFWVMGEQSAKHLRGSSMKDLIFSGSAKYSPGAYAEVSLILENTTNKHIHISGKAVRPLQIELTRKLYRNGETEYRINGEQARLKDIHEVFMDTGAGAKSYSIIAQGEINKLVQAKPEERRVMIEEVAGITKFKLRKRESLKKLEHTHSNLSRLEDLQQEIYKNLKNLERQAEKAEKARTLKERIKKYDLIVSSHKEFEFLQSFVNAQDMVQTRKQEMEEALIRQGQLDHLLEDERAQKDDYNTKIEVAQSQYNEKSKELAASTERLKNLKSNIQEKTRLLESRAKENEELKVDITNRQERLAELNLQLEEILGENPEEFDLEMLEAKVEELKDSWTNIQDEVANLDSGLGELKEELSALEQGQFKNTAKLEEFSRIIQDSTQEIEEIEKQTTHVSDELIADRNKVNELMAQEVELHRDINEQKLVLEELKKQRVAQEEGQRVLSRELIQLESRIESLVSLNNETDGKKRGAQEFLETNEDSALEILGNIIECEPQYAKSVEALLGETLDGLISSQGREHLKAFLDRADQGMIDLILPFEEGSSSEVIERLELAGCEEITSLVDVVKLKNDDFQETIKKWLGSFYIVRNLDREIAAKINPEAKFQAIVSLDGKVLLKRSANSLTYSFVNTDEIGMGVVERNNLIHSLKEEFEVVKANAQENDESLHVTLERIAEHEKGYASKEENWYQVKTDLAGLKASVESREKSFSGQSSRLETLRGRIEETSKLKFDLLEAEESTQHSLSNAQEKIENFENTKAELVDKEREARTQYENERDDLLEMKVKAQSYQGRVDSVKNQLSDANSQIERYQFKLESNQELLTETQNSLDELENEITSLESETEEKNISLQDAQSMLALLKEQFADLLFQMKEKEDEAKAISQKIAKIEKDNVELELRAAKIIEDEDLLVRDNFEKYRIDLRKVIQDHLEISSEKLSDLKEVSSMYLSLSEEGEEVILEAVDYTFEKRFPGQVKEFKDKLKEYKTNLNRLGEINWQAIEDYDKQKLRYDFLRSQEEELKKSLTDLETAITHIDEKSKARFKEAFTEVNERFSKVFPIIFGGGSAHLQVIGSLESSDCGVEIIAQPPGKKMQSIQLMSGGEKAMTAVSLIFSIFLVKPSPFCLLDEVDAPLDDANVGRFNELLREMSTETQFILITHNKKTMELNDTLYGVTMQEPGVSNAVSVQLH